MDLLLVADDLAGVPAELALRRNNGDGTFTRDLSIPPDHTQSFGSTWADYDNDGWPDLFVGNFGTSPTRLYENNGNGTFTQILTGSIVTPPLWCEVR